MWELFSPINFNESFDFCCSVLAQPVNSFSAYRNLFSLPFTISALFPFLSKSFYLSQLSLASCIHAEHILLLAFMQNTVLNVAESREERLLALYTVVSVWHDVGVAISRKFLAINESNTCRADQTFMAFTF